jgi:hypothetical protein
MVIEHFILGSKLPGSSLISCLQPTASKHSKGEGIINNQKFIDPLVAESLNDTYVKSEY